MPNGYDQEWYSNLYRKCVIEYHGRRDRLQPIVRAHRLHRHSYTKKSRFTGDTCHLILQAIQERSER